MKLLVQNPYPERVGFPNDQILGKFRAFLGDEEADLLRHQSEALHHVLKGSAMRLVAGTASGKTLSVALPLFEKLERGEIRKVLFLYPTLALMQDQRQVMDRLTDIYGFEDTVGVIRGGMPRSKLVNSLGKKIIVATPDAVYWFLRKNVKYSHLLIYGLLLADEIVVDEAHLFAGLSAQNLAAFLDRIRILKSRYFESELRVHLLTATWPQDGTLEKLSPEAVPIDGYSLVGDVRLEIQREDDFQERSLALVQGAREFLDNGAGKVLQVHNSARGAHIAFNQITSARADARKLEDIPDEFKLKFGVLEVRHALEVAERFELLRATRAGLREDVPVRASRVRTTVEIFISAEVLARSYGVFLEREFRNIRSRVWRIARARGDFSGAELEIGLGAQAMDILKELSVGDCTDYTTFKETLEGRVGDAQAEVERALEATGTDKGIRLTLPCMPELDAMLGGVPCFREFVRGFRGGLVLDGETASPVSSMPTSVYRGVKIPAAKFLSWFDEGNRARLEPEILDKIEHRAVRKMKDRDDGAIAILYSGSMPRYAREGLVDLFDRVQMPVVLVSTSAVEVGVDFDADALITEECAGSSFLQRFGRVGRKRAEAKVKLLVGAGAYATLQEKLDGCDVVDRGKFSETIMQTLPERLFLRDSRYVEALQYAVTYQVGEVGREVADRNSSAEILLEELQESGVELSYGLRGTMPGVQLREGIGKSPFYALRFADRDRILSADSPFELARLDRAFDEIIYTSREDQRDVFVDLEQTWTSIRLMAYLDADGALRTHPIPRAWMDVESFRNALVQVEKLEKADILTPEFLAYLEQMLEIPELTLRFPKVFLFYGDVALGLRAADHGGIERMPHRLQDQWMLLIPGADAQGAMDFLSEHGSNNLEELFYDYDGLKHRNGLRQALGLVILEEQAGACIAVWERMVRG